jgi:hypothetical protein
MALSMDEQRMLAEIERRLAAEDPGLAIRLSSFRRPGPSSGRLRTRKGRVVMLACTIALIAVVSAVIYALVTFRSQVKVPSTPRSPHQTSAYSAQGGAGSGN